MAKDLYESRKMYQSPFALLIMIPLGMIVFFFIFDFGFKYYNDYKIKKDTKEILYNIMESTIMKTKDDYLIYAQEEFQKRGYDTNDLSLTVNEDSIVLIKYHSYFSMMTEFTTGKKKIAVARFKGYYNEHKETVIEEIVE